MKVVRIVEKNSHYQRRWGMAVVCQVLIGSSYVYGAIICKTMCEAFAIKEGQILDVEKVKFSRRTNTICK